jgi:hypothetical protein
MTGTLPDKIASMTGAASDLGRAAVQQSDAGAPE